MNTVVRNTEVTQEPADLHAHAAPRAAQLRATLANFATGVAVITTADTEGTPFGVTVNSFNAVSLDPPLVLWSLGLQAWSLPVFRRARGFAVNILSEAQTDICRLFSSREEERFSRVEWETGLDGLPLIGGAVATLECDFWARYPGGDHEIMVGQVRRCAHTAARPLVYCQGRFAAPARG